MNQVAQAHPWQYDGNNDDESTIKMINSHDVTSDATKKVVLQYFENSIDHNAGVQKFIPDGWWGTREFCYFLPKTFSLFWQFCTLPHWLTGKFALQNLQEIWRKSCHFGIFAVPLNLNKYLICCENPTEWYFKLFSVVERGRNLLELWLEERDEDRRETREERLGSERGTGSKEKWGVAWAIKTFLFKRRWRQLSQNKLKLGLLVNLGL